MDKNQLVTLIAALIGLFAVLIARSLPEGHRAYKLGSIVTIIGLIVFIAILLGRNALPGNSPPQTPTHESLRARSQVSLATVTPTVEMPIIQPTVTPAPFSTPDQAQQMIIPGTEPTLQTIFPDSGSEQQVIMPGPDAQQMVITPQPGPEGAP